MKTPEIDWSSYDEVIKVVAEDGMLIQFASKDIIDKKMALVAINNDKGDMMQTAFSCIPRELVDEEIVNAVLYTNCMSNCNLWEKVVQLQCFLENMKNKWHKNIDFEKSHDKIEVKLEKKCLQLFAF